MDNLTHSLTGLALSRAGLVRLSPRATALLILSANAPDLDIVAVGRGALPYLEAHRGYTHSFICLPLVAAVCVLCIAGVFRQKLPWWRAFALACVGLASHLLLDWTNSYGVRLLLPFSSAWFYADLNALYDWTILAVLLFAAVWPLFSGLVSSEIGARGSEGRGLAIAALLFFIVFDVGRALAHKRAVDQLLARLYDGVAPQRAAAFPNPGNPLVWRGVAETETAVHLFRLDISGQIDSDAGQVFYKPRLDDVAMKLKQTEPFRFFSYFSRYPAWAVQTVSTDTAQGQRIEISDLRFGAPGEGSFHCVGVVDGRGQVLLSRFTYGSGAELGWGKDQSQLSILRPPEVVPTPR